MRRVYTTTSQINEEINAVSRKKIAIEEESFKGSKR